MATYLLSALWHGFFVGYYLTFATAALLTIAGRTVRRCLRHRLRVGRLGAAAYDLLSYLATQLFLTYATFPFTTLHLNPGLFLYK